MNTRFSGLLLSIIVSLAGAARAETIVSVTQITHGPKHHYFGYIGQSRTVPWNASGRYVLALQVGFQDRLPGANDPADVCLLDTRNNHAVRVVDQTRGWNPQQGTMFYWNPQHPETQFFFNDRDPKTGKIFTVLFDLSADGGKGKTPPRVPVRRHAGRERGCRAEWRVLHRDQLCAHGATPAGDRLRGGVGLDDGGGGAEG